MTDKQKAKIAEATARALEGDALAERQEAVNAVIYEDRLPPHKRVAASIASCVAMPIEDSNNDANSVGIVIACLGKAATPIDCNQVAANTPEQNRALTGAVVKELFEISKEIGDKLRAYSPDMPVTSTAIEGPQEACAKPLTPVCKVEDKDCIGL